MPPNDADIGYDHPSLKTFKLQYFELPKTPNLLYAA